MDSDLKEIFAQYGEVKSAKINYDKTDRSTGEAEVIFVSRPDAEKAVRELDGALINQHQQPISVKFVGISINRTGGRGGKGGQSSSSSSTSADGSLRIGVSSADSSQRVVTVVGESNGRKHRGGGDGGFSVASTVSTPGGIRKGSSSGFGGRRRGGRGGGGGRRGRGGRERSAPPTKEDLDAEMEDYHQNAE